MQSLNAEAIVVTWVVSKCRKSSELNLEHPSNNWDICLRAGVPESPKFICSRFEQPLKTISISVTFT